MKMIMVVFVLITVFFSASGFSKEKSGSDSASAVPSKLKVVSVIEKNIIGSQKYTNTSSAGGIRLTAKAVSNAAPYIKMLDGFDFAKEFNMVLEEDLRSLLGEVDMEYIASTDKDDVVAYEKIFKSRKTKGADHRLLVLNTSYSLSLDNSVIHIISKGHLIYSQTKRNGKSIFRTEFFVFYQTPSEELQYVEASDELRQAKIGEIRQNYDYKIKGIVKNRKYKTKLYRKKMEREISHVKKSYYIRYENPVKIHYWNSESLSKNLLAGMNKISNQIGAVLMNELDEKGGREKPNKIGIFVYSDLMSPFNVITKKAYELNRSDEYKTYFKSKLITRTVGDPVYRNVYYILPKGEIIHFPYKQ